MSSLWRNPFLTGRGRTPGLLPVCMVLLIVGFAPRQTVAEEPLDDARAILKVMSDYVAGEQTIEAVV